MTSASKAFSHTCKFGLMLLVLIMASCDQMTDYKETVRSGLVTLPWPMQMEKLFGEGDHFITNFGLDPGPKQWHSEIYFGGRYNLGLELYVEIDSAKNAVVKATTPPKFYVWEVTNIVFLPDGRPSTDYGKGWELDEIRWNKLVAAKGDWSALGISLKTNDPVAGFDAYVKAWRSPRVRVRP